MKNSKIYLDHILDCIGQIKEYTANLNKDGFLKNRLIQDAVIRNFEIIGEATKQIEEGLKLRHSHIEWKKIAGLRDKLIHDYIGVDLWAVWNVVVDIIPSFEKEIEKIINKEFSDK
ncbi:MAG: DUF86 domain-containing protein [Bacteroidia bacterium]|nr:DUF86 domain-containing protein [Bacteroidia bacterium]